MNATRRRPRPGATPPAAMRAAYVDGYECATSGRPRVNPFFDLNADRNTRMLAVMWARGYSTGNPMPRLRAGVR